MCASRISRKRLLTGSYKLSNNSQGEMDHSQIPPNFSWTVTDFKDMNHLHCKVEEFTPPSLDQIQESINFIDRAYEHGKAVGIHCQHGIGRTGTVVACYFVEKHSMTAVEAISHIRSLRRWSIETTEQEQTDHKQTGAQGSSVENLSGSRRRLARIRCILECIQCLKERKKFPACICFVPSEVEYKCQSKTTLRVYPEPLKNSRKIKDLHCTTESRVVASGEEYCNSQGKWLRIKRFRVTSNDEEKFDNEAWIQQFSSKSSNEEAPVLVPVDKALKRTNPISNWEEVVEQHFAIQLPKKKLDIMAADEEAVDKLRQVPANWSIECEEALVRLMSQHIPPENDHLGSIKNYVEAVDVSSCCDESTGSSPLTDGDPDTYWESDGSAGRHWIELKMKKGAVISELKVTLDGSDDNYLPRKLVVEGGEPNNFTVLNTVNITWEISDVEDIPLLENSTEHYPYIMIRIKECKSGGIDTRIREIKITASEGRYMGFDMDVFKKDNLVRFPKLESYTSEQLYRRSIVIQRFISILDNVLKYLVPSWKYSVGSYSSLEFIRQLLPLSKKRMHLIETFVKESATE
ncbi:HECTD3 [Mytilus coruscus]|uniref:HECTD3 n=1 Tax=Mytilus coruscus TaxID=42192 RepID=A0A6J8BRR1_MYTCO|nr:HECTD3 [Mytilus coruscus]